MKYQMSFRAKTRYPPGSPALHHHPSPLKFPISFQVPRIQVRLLCGPNHFYCLWLMALVSCRILCGLLGSLTKTLQSLQSIVFTVKWFIFPLQFDALFLTDIIAPYVNVTSSSAKTDRDEDNASSISSIQLAICGLFYRIFSNYNIKAKFVPPMNNVASLELRQNECSL